MNYETKAQTLPDSNFKQGTVKEIVVGNSGRYLDPRRTPGKIIDINVSLGLFYWEIGAFEDKGGIWELSFEAIERFQFEHTASELSKNDLQHYQEICKKHQQPLVLSPSPQDHIASEQRIKEQQQQVNLSSLEQFASLEALQHNLAAVQTAFAAHMQEHNLLQIETTTAKMLVSNPYSGEWVKQLKICLANMGYAHYDGYILRNVVGIPDTKEFCRYITQRMAFVRALFEKCRVEDFVLFRGIASTSPWQPKSKTFSSWSLDSKVALALSTWNPDNTTEFSYLLKRKVRPHEVFMSYIETPAMNKIYREQEFLLFHNEAKGVF